MKLLERPRIVFLYCPHGPITESVSQELRPLLDEGDILVDGGNSHREDSERRHASFAEAAPVVVDSQQALMEYRDRDWPAAKVVALLRNQFGGHPIHRKEEGLSRAYW